jgi:hypothetical protein
MKKKQSSKGGAQVSRSKMPDVVTADPELLERGLRVVERQVELGQVLVDLLAVDAAGRPVLVYLARNWTEEQAVPLRAMDGDYQFRRYRQVLRKVFPGQGLNWELAPRSVVAAWDFDRQTLERFLTMNGLEADLVELRSVKVAGQERWAGIPVAGESARDALMPPERVPESLEDTFSKELWHSVYDRVLKLDANLDVLSDKYFREISSRGEVLALMQARGEAFTVTIPASPDREEETRQVEVKGDADADRAVDLVIQRYLALHVGDLDNATAAGEEEAREEAVKPPPALAPIETTVEASNLTDEEISAFLDFQEGNEEGGRE